ncbi:MAG: hypothetical protein HC875_25320 [Anaerolineales bacterium]|nr:hypothetical protein [Anaerolineales bacterium]
MPIERPDLSQIDPAVLAYIESLEAELERLTNRQRADARVEEALAAPLEPSEPPTTLNVITVSASGQAKRTPRTFTCASAGGAWASSIWKRRKAIRRPFWPLPTKASTSC